MMEMRMCGRKIMCIWVISVVSLFKLVNVESIHIEVEKESHKHSCKILSVSNIERLTNLHTGITF